MICLKKIRIKNNNKKKIKYLMIQKRKDFLLSFTNW